MSRLPDMPHPLKRRLYRQTSFYGLDRRPGAGDGGIRDMENMCSDHAPLLTPRAPRRFLAEVKRGRGLFYHDGNVYWIDGRGLFRDGEKIAVLEDIDAVRTFAAMNRQILIFPDAVSLDPESLALKPLSVSVGADVTFLAEGLRYGTKASSNSIRATSLRWRDHFRVGDAVTITGCMVRPQNNKTAVIREIDGDTLRFDENCFDLLSEYRFTAVSPLPADCYSFLDGENDYHFTPRQGLKSGDTLIFRDKRLFLRSGDEETELRAHKGREGTFLNFAEVPLDTAEGKVSFSREVPDFDDVCVVNNRLWGVKGSAVYGSKLGDPFNFSVFDRLSDDSYYLETESDGDFTAAAAVGGYALFFKERAVYKLYGDTPFNFRLYSVAGEGVMRGAEDSVAVIENSCFYLASSGVIRLDGSSPQLISEPLCERMGGGVAVADGAKYYLSALLADGSSSLFVYDAKRDCWHREDDLEAIAAVRGEVPLALTRAGKICTLAPGTEAGESEGDVCWLAEFADMAMNSPLKKGVHRIILRLSLEEGSKATAEIMFDSGNVWEIVGTVRGDRKHSAVLPIVPRRCDHFKIRIRGRGPADLCGLALQYEIGSEYRGGVINHGR